MKTEKTDKQLKIELARELFAKSAIVGADAASIQDQANMCLEAAILFYGEMDLFLEIEE